MPRGFRILLNGALIGLIIGAMAPPARAGSLTLTITETGPSGSGLPINIVDNFSPFDVDPAVGVIKIAGADFNPLLIEFQLVRDLTATINSGVPNSNEPALLSLIGDVQRTSFTGTATLTIDTVATGVTFPVGNPKVLTASGNDTFIAAGSDTKRGFQGFFNDQGTSVATLSPPPFNHQVRSRDLGIASTPYTLKYSTTITMGPAPSPGSPPEDRLTGTVQVAAVPELDPGSAAGALTLLIGGALTLAGWRPRNLRRSEGGGS